VNRRTPARLALAALVLPSVAFAQRGEHAPHVLSLPASTRALGLADAYVAVRDVDALLYNPALLALGRSGGAAGSVERYGSNGTLFSLAGSNTLGDGAGVGVALRWLSYDALTFSGRPTRYRDAVRGLHLGGNVAASSTEAALAGAATLFGVRVGASAQWVEERIGAESDAHAAATLGAAKNMGVVTVGAALQDIGGSVRIAGERLDLPTRLTVGFAGGGLPVGPVDFGLSTALSVRRDGRVMPAAGVEFDYSPLEGVGGVLRLGGRVPEPGAESPLTGGATVYLDRISLDVAVEGYAGRGTGVRVGMRVR
jgi:hypothetical protein